MTSTVDISEKDVLHGFLRRHRGALVALVRELGDENAEAIQMPSGTTALGVISHLAWMERWWFEATFAGEPVDFPWTDDDPDADWRRLDGENTDAVIDRYVAAARRSNEIIAAAELGDVAAQPDLPPFPIGDQTLRWILVHMIEETAQHLGHAEILRELTQDGRAGQAR